MGYSEVTGSVSKLSYSETVEEIKDLQEKIRAHQEGELVLNSYVQSLKRLQFLRDSLRMLKKNKKD